MSRWTSVEISPETTAMPVLTSVSQATRPSGSSAMIASRTPSEIWSLTLSGWPSVTDSEVKRCSFSASGLVGMAGKPRESVCWSRASIRSAAATAVGHEVDHQRHALETVVLAHAVLQVVGPVADDQLAVVDLDRDPHRALSHLGRVVEPQAPAAARGRRHFGDDVGDEAVQIRGGDALAGAVGQLQRFRQQRMDVATPGAAEGHHRRREAQLALH